MYDSDLTITTSHWLHQLPTVGKGWWQVPSYELSFCCNSGSDGKTQPYYWLATDPTTKTRQRTKKDRKGKEQGKTKNKWAYRKLPTYMTWSKIILKMPKAEIPNRYFSLRTNTLVLFRRTFKG
jgi:hypothetical protein